MKPRRPTPKPTQAPSTPPTEGFQYSREQFEALADIALTHARRLGATDGGVEVSEGSGLSVSVRKGALENVERNRDKSLGITVYLGQRRGNASTSDFSPEALQQTVRAAYDIARYTAEDPAAGLPDEEDLALGKAATRVMTVRAKGSMPPPKAITVVPMENTSTGCTSNFTAATGR